MSRLKETYETSIRPQLMKEFGYANPYQAPRLEKIVVNVGMGEAIDNPKLLDTTVEELAAITGQRPAVTRARKSISNFRLREDMAIGAKVTLRGERMYEFLDRLINVAIPRIRDFRGVPTRSFDGRGNYTIGIKEQLIFPEVDYDKVDKVHGMDITIVTTAERDDEALALLSSFGMPFRRQAVRQVAANV
ncbi:MAG: 50S ribosomal protein L5 [Gemmatimonadota bacterium]